MIHNFSKGLNTDVQVSLQPEGTYRFALNFVHNTTEGDQGAISNEPGTVVYCALPEGFKIIGKTVLNDDIILFLVNNGVCIIGTIDTRLAAPTLTKIYDGTAIADLNQFNFNINYPIDAQARIDFRGNRIVYWTDNNNKPRYVDLDLTPSEIAIIAPDITKATSNQVEYNTPFANFVNLVDNSGSLKTGVYQLAARFLTPSFNATPIGPLSGLIPTGVNKQTLRNDYEGGYDKDTGQAINFSITCADFLDNIYPFVELVVVRYGFPSNVPIIEVVKRLDNTGSTITGTYTGNELVLEQLPIEAVTVKPIIYDRAKAVEQLQGRLFWSNLGSKTDTLPFQKIANKIRGKWITKTLTVSDFNDYKGAINHYENASYQRDEVYSFGIVFRYKDGRESLVYHIPADSTWAATAVSLGGGQFTPGKFASSENYPANQDYPSGDILHYKTPTNIQSPHYEWNGSAYEVYPLGIEFTDIIVNGITNNSDITSTQKAEFLSQIEGYSIVRQDRLSSGNRSIFAQGYLSNVVALNNDDYNAPSLTPTTKLNQCIKQPLLQESTVYSSGGTNDYFFTHPAADNPTQYNENVKDVLTYFDAAGEKGVYTEEFKIKHCVLYSPETIFGQLENQAYTLEAILSQQINVAGFTTVSSSIVDADSGGLGFKTFFSNNVYSPTGSPSSSFTAITKNINEVINVQPQDEESPAIFTSKVLNDGTSNYFLREYSNTEATILKLDANVTTSFRESSLTNKRMSRVTVGDGYGLTSSIFEVSGITVGDGVYIINNQNFHAPIFNIKKANSSQYGSVANQPYILIDSYTSINPLSSTNGNSIQCYNGDTFINKMGFKSCTAFPQRALKSSGSKYYPATADDIRSQSGGLLRYGAELFFETTYNTYYRHQYTEDLNGDGDTSDPNETGIPYYPKNTIAEVLTANPAFGESKSFNTQYRLQNSLNSYVSKPAGFISVGQFPNRTIYSEQMLEGEQLDAYREYRPLNFQDTPKHKGEIWDNFVYNNTLYLHTPRTLFKTFVNPIAQQPNDIGSIILGSGGVFQLPPQELFTIAGGYSGSISQFAGQLTPFGYIFPDVLQGKLFIFNEGIAEVTEGLTRYFQNNFKLITSDTSYNDNPFNSRGVLSGYDFDFQRYLITYFDKNGIASTLSYYPKLKVWSSFHSYKPNYYISADNKFFSGNINLHKHNEGLYGNYYGVEYDSSLQLITNEALLATKVFDNQILNMQSRNSNALIVNRTGDTAYWETESDSTAFNISGIKTPNNLLYNQAFVPAHTDNEVLTIFDNKEYRLAIPRNNVIDAQGGLGVTNLDTLTGSRATRLFNLRNRLKGKYLISNFTFNNSQNFKLVINYIQSIFRKNER
jgi:hypothetical protein